MLKQKQEETRLKEEARIREEAEEARLAGLNYKEIQTYKMGDDSIDSPKTHLGLEFFDHIPHRSSDAAASSMSP